MKTPIFLTSVSLICLVLLSGCLTERQRQLQGTVAYFPMFVNSFKNRELAPDLMSYHDGLAKGYSKAILGPVGGALLFDGVDDTIAVASHDKINFGKGDFSISAWIQTSYETRLQVSIDKRDPRTIGYALFLEYGTLGFHLGDQQGFNLYTQNLGPNLADGEWHFVTVTLARQQPDGLRFYVDGTLIAEFDATNLTHSIDNEAELWIGRGHSIPTVQQIYHNHEQKAFHGAIDDVKLFDRELTHDEVLEQFNIRFFSV